MNRYIATGRLCKEPEIRTKGESVKFVRNSIAIDYFNWSTKSREAIFVNITVFGRLAEILCEYSDKGKKIAIEGYLVPNSYINKEGTKIYEINCIVEKLEIIEFKENKQAKKELSYPEQPTAHEYVRAYHQANNQQNMHIPNNQNMYIPNQNQYPNANMQTMQSNIPIAPQNQQLNNYIPPQNAIPQQAMQNMQQPQMQTMNSIPPNSPNIQKEEEKLPF